MATLEHTLPWETAPQLSSEVFQQVRLRTIFDCHKWDPQVEDVSILADFGLILTRAAWQEIAALAEALAAETMAAEHEIMANPRLLDTLTLPPQITRFWKQLTTREALTTGRKRDVRIIRFDFHYTTDGWRISEANSDTPAGYNEASGYTRLMAAQYPHAEMTADPVLHLAQQIRQHVDENANIAMVHPTAFAEDRQIMLFIGDYLKREGLNPVLASPAHLKWDGATHEVWFTPPAVSTPVRVDYLVRFFPAEWLPDLANSYPWRSYFAETYPPATNPTTALVTQTKRFPLVWDALKTPMTTWRSLLPETRDPRTIPPKAWDQWVFKPVFGRIGEGIAIPGVTGAKAWEQSRKEVRRHPQDWIAQRPFEPVPMHIPTGLGYPCIGVYTVNGKAAGTYGRLGIKKITDSSSIDIPILVRKAGESPQEDFT